ncbi:unnamed protein product [Cercospora beticola]|nr:unnamed protein product [Cercospora beticola]
MASFMTNGCVGTGPPRESMPTPSVRDIKEVECLLQSKLYQAPELPIHADKDAVQKVYKNIWGTDDQEGSIDLGYIFWTNKDIKGICTTPGTEKVGDSITLAYIGNLVRNNQQIAIAHMCDQGYDVPKRSDVSCDSLGSTVSTLMDVLGAIILHEYTHFDRIGKAATGTHIGDKAYGPLDVKGLSDSDKLINADSYRWLALEYYWTTVCGKTFSGPRDDRDNDESACQPGKCIVQ